MQNQQSRIEGLWLPLITPFKDGRLDEDSWKNLLRHYGNLPVDGLILAAMTGEGLTLDEDETTRLVAIAADVIAGGLPIYLGLSGSDTRKVAQAIERTESWSIDGYLITCPYYTRPAQDGLYHHFAMLAEQTDRPIMVYNIPYRTGVNIENETLLRLADVANIVAVKDCCVDPLQSFDLLRHRPAGFAVLTGEDAMFFGALAQGADGGILAAAHVETQRFAGVRGALVADNHQDALRAWTELFDVVRLLFAEPSPTPIKHWLWRLGLIHSPEVRLPMTGVSTALAARLDSALSQCGHDGLVALRD
ncbi:MAG TPA: 4-hydroxy-tetrahydrodipicolinate synthase [Alphaproteobacteria bacterium]|nr:4-hydroxy-tetrahydrodipicolinate synthase [Alphaproteobacteria bacterium]